MEEVMDDMLDNGTLHRAPNENLGREIANEMQKLTASRWRGTASPTLC